MKCAPLKYVFVICKSDFANEVTLFSNNCEVGSTVVDMNNPYSFHIIVLEISKDMAWKCLKIKLSFQLGRDSNPSTQA